MKIFFRAVPSLMLLLALVTPVASNAQKLADLQQGALLKVTYINGSKYEGRLMNRVDTTIKLLGHSGEMVAPTTEVKTAEVYVGKSHGAGLFRTGLKSALIGSLVGAGIGYATYTPCTGLCYLAPSSAGVSAAGGAIVVGVPSLIIGGIVGAIRGADVWRPIY